MFNTPFLSTLAMKFRSSKNDKTNGNQKLNKEREERIEVIDIHIGLNFKVMLK